MHRGHHRDAKIDGASRDPQPETTVLGHAPLRDVELGHDLDAGDDGLGMALLDGRRRLVEGAVDTVFGENRPVLRLDMDVGGPSFDGTEQQRIDEPNDRTLRSERLEIDDFSLVLRHEFEPGAEILAGPVEQGLPPTLPSQTLRDISGRRHHRVDRTTERELGLGDALEREGRSECEDETRPGAAAGHAGETSQGLDAEAIPKRRVLAIVVEGKKRKPESLSLLGGALSR